MPTKSSTHSLAPLSTCIDHIKLEIVINSFIKSQFNYCPLVWMFHGMVLNSNLNLIQERASRLVCKGSETEWEKLMSKTLTTHQHNLMIMLMTEIYETKQNLNRTFARVVFTETNNHYNLDKIPCNCQRQNNSIRIRQC